MSSGCKKAICSVDQAGLCLPKDTWLTKKAGAVLVPSKGWVCDTSWLSPSSLSSGMELGCRTEGCSVHRDGKAAPLLLAWSDPEASLLPWYTVLTACGACLVGEPGRQGDTSKVFWQKWLTAGMMEEKEEGVQKRVHRRLRVLVSVTGFTDFWPPCEHLLHANGCWCPHEADYLVCTGT